MTDTAVVPAWLHRTETGAETILTPRIARLDAGVSSLFLNHAGPMVAHSPRVVVDLLEVRYVDHFGFEAMLSLVELAEGLVRFRNASTDIRSLFVLAHLSRLLEADGPSH